jgi:hypothetical protein
MLGVARHAHAPVEGGARDREVLQPTRYESKDLVEALTRQHEIGMARVVLKKPVLIGGESEEVTLLLYPLNGRAL